MYGVDYDIREHTWCDAVHTDLDFVVAEVKGQLTRHLHCRSLADLAFV
jgi:hypothetical protein